MGLGGEDPVLDVTLDPVEEVVGDVDLDVDLSLVGGLLDVGETEGGTDAGQDDILAGTVESELSDLSEGLDSLLALAEETDIFGSLSDLDSGDALLGDLALEADAGADLDLGIGQADDESTGALELETSLDTVVSSLFGF